MRHSKRFTSYDFFLSLTSLNFISYCRTSNLFSQNKIYLPEFSETGSYSETGVVHKKQTFARTIVFRVIDEIKYL